MDGMYLSCHMGSLITPSLYYQTCRQTAVKQRIPSRLSETAQHSDNEPRLTSVHISAAISPVIIKLHRADRQIHINERSGALDLAQLNVSALTLATVPTSRKWCSTWTLIIWDVVKTPLQSGNDIWTFSHGLIESEFLYRLNQISSEVRVSEKIFIQLLSFFFPTDLLKIRRETNNIKDLLRSTTYIFILNIMWVSTELSIFKEKAEYVEYWVGCSPSQMNQVLV